MTLFLNQPDRAYFIRELTRLIDTQINAVRREIDNLIQLGMIIETVEQDADSQKRPGLKRKYYQVNTRFPLLAEIQSLMSKSHFLMERRIDQQLVALGDVSYLAFMGSFLGKQAPVDLFLVATVDKKALSEFVRQAEKDLGFEINFTCLTPQEFTYRKDIADRFLQEVLDAPKHVVVDKPITNTAV